MNKIKTGNVGLNMEVIRAFVLENKAQLETECLPLPGKHGEEGVMIMKTDRIDRTKRLSVVTGIDVDGHRYTIYLK